MKIAVCDDEKEIRESVRTHILRLYPDAQVTVFGGGSELLARLADFDIIFLDIKMEGADGMETARTLRKNGSAAVIIFITALEEYVYQAFDVGAFHYLLKPIDTAKFYEVLRKAAEQCRAPRRIENEESILVKVGRDREKIFLSEVIYAEVFDRKLMIHTADREIECYGRLSELEKRAGNDFFRPHRAYLINLRYVLKYNSTEICLDGPRKCSVSVSKQKYPEFVRKYLEYLKTESKK